VVKEASPAGTAYRLLPLLDWLPSYRRTWLRQDMIAGLTTAAVVIPKAMAYATVAGLPVEVGLYTAFAPMAVYALLGTSRPLSVSTTTTLGILTGANLALVVPNGDPAALLAAAATLTVLVGAVLVLSSLLRLGFVASFISEPVLIGFKAGIGVVIVADQLPKLLGIHVPPGPFLQKLLALIGHLGETSAATLALGAAMIAILAALERWLPRVPAPLVAVAAGIAASALGTQRLGVETVGHIPQGLPSYALPQLDLLAVLRKYMEWPA
jgi:MFS superfamily sulfate permease-like transporter